MGSNKLQTSKLLSQLRSKLTTLRCMEKVTIDHPWTYWSAFFYISLLSSFTYYNYTAKKYLKADAFVR